MLNFKIEQIAICPPNPERAIALLSKLGMDQWSSDHVCATGEVFGDHGSNEANLHFNYQADRNSNQGVPNNQDAITPLEFEVLEYTDGPCWTDTFAPAVSHLGMHVTADQLAELRTFFAAEGIDVAQEVNTTSHTNPHIADSRRYNYVIFDTRAILGVDLKFIVRKNIEA
jgi:hypothetical protein